MSVLYERAQAQPVDMEAELSYVLSENATLVAELLEAREEIKRLEEEARQDDLIPELLSKKAIIELVEQRILQAKPFGVFFIDLNSFKIFNDTHGHRQGDEMLRKVGVTLADGFRRQTDALGVSAGHVGGDEFIVLIDLDDGGHNRASSYQEQMDNIYDFIESLEKRFLSENQSAAAAGVGFAAGGAYYNPDNPVDIGILLDQADEAMYDEKNGRR